MLHFYEIPCDQLFVRKFTLTDDGVKIGGGTLKYVNRVIEVVDVTIDKSEYADLLAGALLNVACNTEVGYVRVQKAPYWARFGLEDKGDCLEQFTEKIVFDSVCKGHHDPCEHCPEKGNCKENCQDK